MDLKILGDRKEDLARNSMAFLYLSLVLLFLP